MREPRRLRPGAIFRGVRLDERTRELVRIPPVLSAKARPLRALTLIATVLVVGGVIALIEGGGRNPASAPLSSAMPSRSRSISALERPAVQRLPSAVSHFLSFPEIVRRIRP